MYFQAKNTLENNIYYYLKHPSNFKLYKIYFFFEKLKIIITSIKLIFSLKTNSITELYFLASGQ